VYTVTSCPALRFLAVVYAILSLLKNGQPIGLSIEQAAHETEFSLLELELNLSDWFQKWAASGYFQAINV